MILGNYFNRYFVDKINSIIFAIPFRKMKRKILAEVVELVDTLDSKSSDSDIVWVRVPPSVPTRSQLSDWQPNVAAFFIL